MTLPRTVLRTVSCCLILITFLFATRNARAQAQPQPFNLNITVCGGGCQALVYGTGIAVVGTILYFSLRAPRTTGCVVDSASGLSLRSDDGTQTYLLAGTPTTAKPGERIKVLGRRKKTAPKQREIVVSKMLKDYGAHCKPIPSPAPS